MSAHQVEHEEPMTAADVDEHEAPDSGPDDRHDAGASVEPVEVRRNAVLSAVLGAASSAVAIAYLWRAAESAAPLDWALCLVMAAFAVVFLRSLLDSRTPLLVADEMGVRIRLGSQWRGLPWEAIDRVLVHPRRGLLRDGRVLVSLVQVTRTLEGLDHRARRQAVLNRKLYGGALAVPLGLATRVQGSTAADLPDRVSALAADRAEVVAVVDTPEAAVIPVEEVRPAPVEPSAPEAPSPRAPRRWGRRSTTTASEPERVAVVPTEEGDDLFGQPVPLHEAESIDRVTPLPGVVVAPRVPDQQRHGADEPAARDAGPLGGGDGRVRAIARLGDPVGPLVIDDYQPEPAYDPVIGPDLAAARTRVGLTVDELADRTRIRPHVIESIEVDDFTPCGGDFYARGHIQTLARVLGKDAVPMLEVFDARYAKAPVNARKVFEAELATGMGGQMRRPYAGASWTGLVATVLVLVLVWALVRLFAGDQTPLLEEPPPVLDGSAGIGNVYDQPVAPQGPAPLRTVLTAATGGAHVEVRDRDGNLVREADLAVGEVLRLRATPPVTVSSDNGAAVLVRVGGRDRGALGATEEPATRTFQRRGTPTR